MRTGRGWARWGKPDEEGARQESPPAARMAVASPCLRGKDEGVHIHRQDGLLAKTSEPVDPAEELCFSTLAFSLPSVSFPEIHPLPVRTREVIPILLAVSVCATVSLGMRQGGRSQEKRWLPVPVSSQGLSRMLWDTMDGTMGLARFEVRGPLNKLSIS